MGARSAPEIWEAALGALQVQVSKQNYRTWLEKTTGLSYRDNQFVIGVPNIFVAEYLDKKQRSLIEKTLIGVIGGNVSVAFQVTSRQSCGARGQTPCPMFNPRYTFSSFVTGSCNRLAHSVALGVAENPGHNHNPLFICGGVGVGKTHLLHAIGHAALARNINVLCVSAERFTNEFVTAICERKTEQFHDKYRSVDMLLVDDIQFISGKEQTEESFFHTFNELYNSNRQIAVTSDLPPRSLPSLPARLRSRFEGGLVAAIQPPDFETRLAILQVRAKQQETLVPLDSLEFIARRAEQNIRELEGMLNRVVAYARLMRAPATPELAARAIEVLSSNLSSISAPALVIEEVAASFHLTPTDLASRKRDKETALARQVAMYLIREETGFSLAQIGSELGGRDHTTVLHACEKIASEVDASPALRRKIAEIQQRVHSRQKETSP